MEDSPIDVTNPGRIPGVCGLCGKPEEQGGACKEHIEQFTAVIDRALDLAQTAGLTDDEAVPFVSAHIAKHLKNEALKHKRPGEFFSPESFKVTPIKITPS